MSYSGSQTKFLAFDEAKSIPSQQFPRVLNATPPKPIIKTISVPCRYCKAEPGTQCQRWRPTKRGQVKQNRNTPHRDRILDAAAATDAVRALNPQ